MDKRHLFLFLITVSIGMAFSEGAVVTGMGVDIHIDSHLVSHEKVIVQANNFHNVNSTYVYLFLSDKPSSVKIYDVNHTSINFSSYIANGVFVIRIMDIIAPNSSKLYYLEYDNSLIRRFDKTYMFNFLFTSYYNLSTFSLRVFLPKGYTITREEGNTIFPPTSMLFSDGQQIIVQWKHPLVYLETYNYMVFFEKVAVSSYSFVWLIVCGLCGAIIGGLIVYYRMRSYKKEIVTMALSRDEKLVVDFVMNHKEVSQKEIAIALDFSKPKLSKIVHNLESKGIVKLIHKGRENIVMLSEDLS